MIREISEGVCFYSSLELESLGINTREESQLKDFKKTTELTTDIKQMFYEEYQKAFNKGL
jgi:hypothetical protein